MKRATGVSASRVGQMWRRARRDRKGVASSPTRGSCARCEWPVSGRDYEHMIATRASAASAMIISKPRANSGARDNIAAHSGSHS